MLLFHFVLFAGKKCPPPKTIQVKKREIELFHHHPVFPNCYLSLFFPWFYNVLQPNRSPPFLKGYSWYYVCRLSLTYAAPAVVREEGLDLRKLGAILSAGQISIGFSKAPGTGNLLLLWWRPWWWCQDCHQKILEDLGGKIDVEFLSVFVF